MKKTLIAIAFVLGFANLAFSQNDLLDKGKIVGRIDVVESTELQDNERVYLVKSIIGNFLYFVVDERELTTGMDVDFFQTQSPGHKHIAELMFRTFSPGHKTINEISIK